MSYDHNQLDIPDSFIALYLVAGRLKPTATRAAIGARYEFCEDLAQQLCEIARAQHFDHGVAQAEVLARCRQGLLGDGSDDGCDDAAIVSDAEAQWVIRRLAELMEWPWRDASAALIPSA